ncbi:hypothetical protein NA56DRAFT_226886 [Hyaloscypha hepaticicola]|uniref:Uncharacterized protein n=1 Tax=Hyaloscypha hepaticicola TaxID=2082293 RepID=A0A2J6QLM4_9HELO|nr:hypothetical protein NA56DRAFT_226886 [Hyaloscypha hepaticicola]
MRVPKSIFSQVSIALLCQGSSSGHYHPVDCPVAHRKNVRSRSSTMKLPFQWYLFAVSSIFRSEFRLLSFLAILTRFT